MFLSTSKMNALKTHPNIFLLYVFCSVLVQVSGTFETAPDFKEKHPLIGAIKSHLLQPRDEAGWISEKCLAELGAYLENLRTPDANSWALAMLDATSKIPSGLLSLNFGELGDFSQCLSIKTNHTLDNNNSKEEIRAKYCLGNILFNPNSSPENSLFSKHIRIQKRANSLGNFGDSVQSSRMQGPTWAICIPSGCGTEDVDFLVNFLMQSVFGDQLIIYFPDNLCQTVDDLNPSYTTGAVVTLVVLGVLIVLVLTSTLFDLYCITYGKRSPHVILLAFSLYSNGKKVFKITEAGPEQFPCLNGLKFISMMWVVIGHQFSLPINGALTNLKDVLEWADSVRSMVLVSGTLSVDTFFVVGGALMSYGFLRAKSRKISFNLFLYYLHRYLRLTPPLALVVFVSSTLIEYMGSGPKWPFAKLLFQQNCVDYWWSTLLYVQNYVNVDKMCVGQTWYLSIDMQLYLVSPIIFLLLWKFPKIGMTLIFACILTTIGLAFRAAWINHLPALLSNIYGDGVLYMNEYYLLTHTRAAPWFVGVVLGYFMFKIKHKEFELYRLNKVTLTILWLATLATLLTCIFGGFDTLRDKNYDRWGNAFHIALVRPVWALAISWIIFACTFYSGGPINWILSLSIYQVLNRFTYSIYLTHVTMLYLMTLAQNVPERFSEFEMAYKFWGTWWFSTGLATFLVFTVESPMIVIEKLIFSRSVKVKERTVERT